MGMNKQMTPLEVVQAQYAASKDPNLLLAQISCS
jgi:hypothetical protein